MVEREKVLHSREQNPRILELKNLGELGIDASFDSLNLAADKFTLGVKKVGEDTVYVGRLNHPFAGIHFAQFLNSVAPFGNQNKYGIIDDVNLPILAERDYQVGKDKTTSESIRLHERHLNDPRVGPAYIRFAEDHANSWLKALKINTGLRVFETLQRIRFVNGTEDFRKELFSEDGSLRRDADTDYYYQHDILSALSRYDHKRYNDFYEKGEKEPLQAFLNTLTTRLIATLTTKTEQEKFAIVYFNMMGQIIADLQTHRITRDDFGRPSRKVKVKFDSNGRDVVISNNNNTGTKVVISPTGQSSERFSWRVKEYQFPRGYIRHSLYPVVAWRNKNGTREFLTQQEAMPLVRELGLPEGEQGDVKLGEIAVAYFARDIIKTWPAKMTLKPLEGDKKIFRGDDFKQEMSGAQMPGWVGVEQHKAELLNGRTSPLAVLERKFNLYQ